MKIGCIGTYDLGKPRTRILLAALRDAPVELETLHVDVWVGVEDKSVLRSPTERLKRLLRWVLAYPRLALKLLRRPRFDVIFVPYLGLLDVLVLWPLARLRGEPMVWDAFLSVWDTVVQDRRLLRPGQFRARALKKLEALACRAARCVLLDTAAHAAFFEATFRLAPGRTAVVFVGAEPEKFPPLPPPKQTSSRPLRVLFYGQFIPLHGIDTIIEAARLARDKPIDWVLVGGGQEATRIREHVREAGDLRLSWKPWVPYACLSDEIRAADVCLGIFGRSDKAARVIPNKVYQILSSRRPLITRDSPAIRELLGPDTAGVRLVPPGDPRALVDAVLHPHPSDRKPVPDDIIERFSPESIGRGLVSVLRRAANASM